MIDSQAVIEYRDYSDRQIKTLAGYKIHFIKDTTGPTIIRVPDHTIFLTESPATTYERWNGHPCPPIHREAGTILYLPANSTLESSPASNPYSETLICLPERSLRMASRGEMDLDSLELRFIVAPTEKVYGITRAFVNLIRSEDPPPLLVESMAVSLAIAVICSADPVGSRALYESKSGLTYSKLRRVQEYVEENLSQSISLDEMAKISNMSAFHFIRSFKVAMGTTPVRYVLNRRVEKAKRMMLTTTKSLVEVSLSCGFSNQSHFTTAFKQATGITPSAWRAQSRP